MNTERRMGNIAIETRGDGKSVLAGHAAVFYREGDAATEYQLGKDLVERIARNAFDEAIAGGDDARALLNHDPNHVLGRRSSGTLRLSVDERGLRYEVDLPDTQAGRDVAELVKRGDITGSSFGFQVTKQKFTRGGKHDVRTIESVRLLDVSPVAFPAYEGTSAAMRSDDCGDALEARALWEKESVEVRLRALAID